MQPTIEKLGLIPLYIQLSEWLMQSIQKPPPVAALRQSIRAVSRRANKKKGVGGNDNRNTKRNND